MRKARATRNRRPRGRAHAFTISFLKDRPFLAVRATDISDVLHELLLRVLMGKIIAHCGITCSDCPTFIATKTNDDAERNRVAELWTKEYGHPFKPEDINCDGCQTKGTRVFNYTKICEIRKCGQERKIENCAYCDEYKCEKISKLHEQAPKPKETLDQLRKNLGKDAKH